MTEVLLSLLQVVHGIDDFMINNWAVIVCDNLTLLPLGVREVELLANDHLGGLERFLGVGDVFVFTEVGHEVVDFVATFLSLMLVLGAASRVADWVRLELGES